MDTLDTSKEHDSTLLFARDSSSSSGDFSGFEPLNLQERIHSKLEGAFFNTFSGNSATSITFYFPVVFHLFLTILKKEYSGQANLQNDTFMLTTHVHKKTVHITVNKPDKSAKISGPGQKLWVDLNFTKRIALNLYKALLNETTSSSQTDTDEIPLTSTPNVKHREPRMSQVPVSPIMPPDTTFPMQQQLGTILEMISFHNQRLASLQDQVLSLTTELIKIKEQQVKPGPSYANVVSTSAPEPTQLDANDTTLPPESLVLSNKKQQKSQNESSNNKSKKQKSKSKKSDTNQSNSQNQRKSLATNKKGKTLILGTSLIKSINEKGLQNGVFCQGISGGTIDSVSERLRMYDLQQFKTVILSVGGNNVSNGTDPEYFEEKLDQAVSSIKSVNNQCEVILCGICPRSDCDVSLYNEIIESIAQEHNIMYVPMAKFFNDKQGFQICRYFSDDGIHFTASGTRHFLDAIEKTAEIRLVQNFQSCAYTNRQSNTRSSYSKTKWQNKTQVCDKCGESNHSTPECRHRYKLRCYTCGSVGHKAKQNNCKRR